MLCEKENPSFPKFVIDEKKVEFLTDADKRKRSEIIAKVVEDIARKINHLHPQEIAVDQNEDIRKAMGENKIKDVKQNADRFIFNAVADLTDKAAKKVDYESPRFLIEKYEKVAKGVTGKITKS